MAEFSDGESGQVENDPYCMDKSIQAKNVKEMNMKMGYHNMADRANTERPPTKMEGEKRRTQLAPDLPGDNRYDYDKNR